MYSANALYATAPWSAFMDKELNEAMKLTSANSINVARFLPQMFYYFHAYAQLARAGVNLDNIVITRRGYKHIYRSASFTLIEIS